MLATVSPAGGAGAQRLLQRAQSLVRDRPRLAAGVLAFVIFAVAAWQVSPSVPGGDEPHYLVITQSLLLDRRSEDREQPPARRLSGVLRRRAGAALHPPRRQRRDLLDPRARPLGARRAGLCARRLPRRRLPAARHRVVRQRARVAPGVAGVGTGRRGLVRLGRGHACGDDHLSQLHGLSGWPWRCDRADRRLGAAARGRGAADGGRAACCRGSSTAPRWRSCRGCTAGSRCSRAASARSCCCACRRRRTRRGRRWHFFRCRRSARSCGSTSFVPSTASRTLRRRTARRASSRSRSFPAGWPACSSISASGSSPMPQCSSSASPVW